MHRVTETDAIDSYDDEDDEHLDDWSPGECPYCGSLFPCNCREVYNREQEQCTE